MSADDKMQGLVVRTLSEQVFEIVRERIVTGQLKSNQPLRQDALAAQLGVSKIPLREALGRLELEGLLVSHANRGYFVQPFTISQLEEIYALRLAIEPSSAAFASVNATEEDRAAAQRAFDCLETLVAGNLPELAIRNREFHVALCRTKDRPLTAQHVQRLAILAERYVVMYLTPAERESSSLVEHRALLEAYLDRDPVRLHSMLTQHLQSTLDDLRAEFDSLSENTQIAALAG